MFVVSPLRADNRTQAEIEADVAEDVDSVDNLVGGCND